MTHLLAMWVMVWLLVTMNQYHRQPVVRGRRAGIIWQRRKSL